jgi:hypothetical protein
MVPKNMIGQWNFDLLCVWGGEGGRGTLAKNDIFCPPPFFLVSVF